MEKTIGGFLQEIRKRKGLTQKELAEKVGISDKTISKWENGNSIPDTSMLLPLCQVLEITVNELLSCELISPEDYSMKAEETIVTLVKENEGTKKESIIIKNIGIVVVCVALFLLGISNLGLSFVFHLDYFIDASILIQCIFLELGIVLICKAREKRKILCVLGKTVLPVGAAVSIATGIYGLYAYRDLSTLGPILRGILLAVFYAFIIKVVVEIFLLREP